MRCINCNYDNLDGLQYCVSCGSPLITLEDKQKQELAGQNKLNKLYLLIGLLVFVLVVMVVLLLLGVGFGKEEEAPVEETVQVEAATVGVWHCNPNAAAKDYTLTFELNEDGTYKFGAYKYLNTSRVEGKFSSNSFGKKDEATSTYNLYNMSVPQLKVINNGKTTESPDEKASNYTLGITDDGEKAMINNAATEVTYYCVKEKKSS